MKSVVQTEGGSIGSNLTREIARVYMIQWDQRLIRKCKDLGLSMDIYSRYVDDQIIVMRAVGKGWTYYSKRRRMVYDSELEKTCNNSEKLPEIMMAERKTMHEPSKQWRPIITC